MNAVLRSSSGFQISICYRINRDSIIVVCVSRRTTGKADRPRVRIDGVHALFCSKTGSRTGHRTRAIAKLFGCVLDTCSSQQDKAVAGQWVWESNPDIVGILWRGGEKKNKN